MASSVTAAIPTAQQQRINYLNLLIAQLRNQNPLEPMDNNQMASQLAQLSQLEQLELMNGSFKSVLAAFEQQYAASLIGKDVSFAVDDSEALLSGPVTAVTTRDGRPLLMVGSYSVPLEDVRAVRGGGTSVVDE